MPEYSIYVTVNLFTSAIIYNCCLLYIISTNFVIRDEFENVLENYLFLKVRDINDAFARIMQI